MLDKVKDIFNFSEHYYVLGVSIDDGLSQYQLIEIRFKDNELQVEKRFSYKTLEAVFKEDLNKDYPFLIHLEGDSIVNKCVENKIGYRSDFLFKANLEDFYFFEYHQNKMVYASVSRKDTIDGIVKQIKDLGFFVIQASFGPFVMANLIPVIKEDTTISSSNYSLEISKTQILNFKTKKSLHTEFNINGDKFSTFELPLLASFLNYKFPSEKIEFDQAFLSNNKEELKFKKWFKFAGGFTLVFFLIALTLSHFLMGHYVEALAEKEALNVISQQTVQKINDLKKEKGIKEIIYQSSGINNQSFLTKYLADIGNTVPETIVINAVNVFPSKKKVKPLKKIDFDISTISIVGESKNDLSFNTWIKKIKTLKWVKKIDIVAYLQDAKSQNSFTVKIKI